MPIVRPACFVNGARLKTNPAMHIHDHVFSEMMNKTRFREMMLCLHLRPDKWIQSCSIGCKAGADSVESDCKNLPVRVSQA